MGERRRAQQDEASTAVAAPPEAPVTKEDLVGQLAARQAVVQDAQQRLREFGAPAVSGAGE